ncbi:hypothetical protein CYMTET_16658 [Cymbomonas tetramitiformis]|uniref:Uncharacterized protein n=1 Tax=Cymbomonas tetramitiformis TaxID=36881 RepID=A0AAE0GBT5_9CHLO|nr:hypothetical protein CYMTET_16658 [Cymbomonas tetramitiformis]
MDPSPLRTPTLSPLSERSALEEHDVGHIVEVGETLEGLAAAEAQVRADIAANEEKIRVCEETIKEYMGRTPTIRPSARIGTGGSGSTGLDSRHGTRSQPAGKAEAANMGEAAAAEMSAVVAEAAAAERAEPGAEAAAAAEQAVAEAGAETESETVKWPLGVAAEEAGAEAAGRLGAGCWPR